MRGQPAAGVVGAWTEPAVLVVRGRSGRGAVADETEPVEPLADGTSLAMERHASATMSDL